MKNNEAKQTNGNESQFEYITNSNYDFSSTIKKTTTTAARKRQIRWHE